jgi:predicted RNA methylase
VRSALHWTPRHVAIRAATWIDELGIRTVVDIGSGAGKFCVAAALAGSATYIGLEQRARLVSVSRKLASHFDLETRVRFVHGTLSSSSLPSAEAYYMYNPFGENLFGPESQIDGDVERSESRYQRDVASVERVLAEMSSGTFLLTYNGFGGQVPSNFCQVRVARDLPNVLEMWKKRA